MGNYGRFSVEFLAEKVNAALGAEYDVYSVVDRYTGDRYVVDVWPEDEDFGATIFISEVIPDVGPVGLLDIDTDDLDYALDCLNDYVSWDELPDDVTIVW